MTVIELLPMKAMIFDLDGTLVDSVYAHVLAWQRAFAEAGIPIDGLRLHRRMGMSGGLFKRAVMRELGRTISMPKLQALDKRHGELFRQFLPQPRPLPGAVELLRFLRQQNIIHGIATSNQRPHINSSLKVLGVTSQTVVVERGDVARAKPEPDLFLECQERLGAERLLRHWRCRLGFDGRAEGGHAQHRPAQRWLRRGRANSGGRVPCISRHRRPPQLFGRARRAAVSTLPSAQERVLEGRAWREPDRQHLDVIRLIAWDFCHRVAVVPYGALRQEYHSRGVQFFCARKNRNSVRLRFAVWI